MLYAGNTSTNTYFSKIYSFNYSILNDIVKRLKRWSKSAGNKLLFGTSETLRNEITTAPAGTGKENIKNISIHNTKHLKPANYKEFGHYLAGLIDGDGHFSSAQQLIIVFNILDIQLAYYIKERLGYGNVRKVKNLRSNAVLFIVSNQKGIESIISLINNKIRTTSKFNQISQNILIKPKYFEFSQTFTLNLNTSNDLNNHWLAGFSDADASFQIKILNRNNRTEVRLNYQIDQRNKENLILIQGYLGGNIGYRQNTDTYYYGSTSFGSAYKVIKYFDHFQMLSTKHINYLKWRKAYLLVLNRDHLTESGVTKIQKLKSTMAP